MLTARVIRGHCPLFQFSKTAAPMPFFTGRFLYHNALLQCLRLKILRYNAACIGAHGNLAKQIQHNRLRHGFITVATGAPRGHDH